MNKKKKKIKENYKRSSKLTRSSIKHIFSVGFNFFYFISFFGPGSLLVSLFGFREKKMHANQLLLEEPIRMASILEPSKPVCVKFCTVSFTFLC